MKYFKALLFIGLFMAGNLLAQDMPLQKWGPIKFGEVEYQGNDPAGKLRVTANKSGGMRSILNRGWVSGDHDPAVRLDDRNLQSLKIKAATVIVDGADLLIQLVFGIKNVTTNKENMLSVPLRFGMIYFLDKNRYISAGDAQIKTETEFFTHDERASHYTVFFKVPYTGSPAQEHILGQREGAARISVWYINATEADYEDLWTEIDLSFSGEQSTPVRITSKSGLDQQIYTSNGKPVLFRIKRELYIEFFGITSGDEKWTVYLPFVPKLNVYLLPGNQNVTEPWSLVYQR